MHEMRLVFEKKTIDLERTDRFLDFIRIHFPDADIFVSLCIQQYQCL